jgi:hypothetical protein
MLLLAACAANSDTADSGVDTADPTLAWQAGDGPDATVSGQAFVFGPNEGSGLGGSTVTVVEAPDRSGVVAEDGSFTLVVPSGAPLSFLLEAEGYVPIQSATISITEAGLSDLGFQVPTASTVELMASAAQVDIDPDRCQIATTVSSADSPSYGGSGVGEPDAVVAMDPGLPDAATGPIYFDYFSDSIIFPDPTLTATTIDGGVLFANVTTGEWTLRATKDGVVFSDAVVRCRPGLMVNAAPPHGIEAE